MKKILIIGNKGQLGSEFCRILQSESVDFIGYDLPEFDVSDFDNVAQVIGNYQPDVVVNCSAYNFVDLAELEPEKSQRVNATGALNLARACHRTKSFLVHFSTDYVFDGTKNQPYTENDSPNPLNQYGHSKLLGEKMIATETENYLILRTSWLYGKGKQNFIYKFLQWSNEKATIKIATDEISVPTSVQTVASVTLHALRKGLCGLYHLTNSGFASRFEWANLLKEVLNLRVEINPAKMEDFNLPAKRPKFSAMANSKIANELGISIPEWNFELKQQVRKYFEL
jgi:dTDP-4-dehydrorhamnose reductase